MGPVAEPGVVVHLAIRDGVVGRPFLIRNAPFVVTAGAIRKRVVVGGGVEPYTIAVMHEGAVDELRVKCAYEEDALDIVGEVDVLHGHVIAGDEDESSDRVVRAIDDRIVLVGNVVDGSAVNEVGDVDVMIEVAARSAPAFCSEVVGVVIELVVAHDAAD